MTARELSELRWLVREIDQLSQELAELEAGAVHPASPRTDGPRIAGQRRDRLAEYAARSERLRGIIAQRCAAAMRERERLEAYIAAVPDSLTRQIMELRFVRGYSWGRVARTIGGGNTAEGVRTRVRRALRKHPGGAQEQGCKK